MTLVVKSRAAASPLSSLWPHSAKKFHLATPAVFGLAVITSTSGLHTTTMPHDLFETDTEEGIPFPLDDSHTAAVRESSSNST